MKFARSSAAILLFVAIAKCMPVATNTDDSASITQSTYPTSVTLANGNTVQSTCNSVQITDTSTGEIVQTIDCNPDTNNGADNGSNNGGDTNNGGNMNNDGNGNGAGSGSSTDTPPPPTTTTTDNSATIVSTGISNLSSTVTLSYAIPTAAPNVDNANSDGDSTTGVGMSIIANGMIGAGDIHPDPGNVDAAAIGAEKGKRFVATTDVTSTPDGPVSENCQIQLTPQANGLYTEVRTCEVSIERNTTATSSVVPSPTPEAIAPSSATSDAVSETSPPPASSTPSSPASSSPSTPTPPTSPVPASSSGPSSDPASSTPETSSPSDGAIVIGTGSTSVSLPSATASAQGSLSSNGTAAADTVSTFAMPGKHLSVLPVGLAVFAGVSVIALVVVGVVTYERTKYRKNFRRRQLAEQLKASADQTSERSLV